MVSSSSKHTLDEYQLDKQPLGVGAYGSVYKGYNQKGETFAIKIFTHKYEKDFRQEFEAYKGLDHPNIVKMHDYKQNAIFRSYNGRTDYECCYIVFDLIMGGELFDYVVQAPTLDERLARSLFSQILKGVVYIHNKGLAHRDLKLENILLDHNFNVKIADFGTAKLVDRYDKLQTYIGTPGYMAPEITREKKRYKGFPTDMFSLGCILFMMCTRMPITEGSCVADDSVYKYIARRRPDLFWKNRHSFAKRYRVEINMTDNLIKLIDDLVCLDPDNRLTLTQVIGHPWMQGEFATQREINESFSVRLKSMAPEKEQERQVKVKANNKVFMSGDSEVHQKVDLPQLPISCSGTSMKRHVLFSNLPPQEMLGKLQRDIERLGFTPLVDSNEYTINYKKEDDDSIELHVRAELNRFDDQNTAIVISTRDGGAGRFLLASHFEELAEELQEWTY